MLSSVWEGSVLTYRAPHGRRVRVCRGCGGGAQPRASAAHHRHCRVRWSLTLLQPPCLLALPRN